jgi:hypothetical protein
LGKFYICFFPAFCAAGLCGWGGGVALSGLNPHGFRPVVRPGGRVRLAPGNFLIELATHTFDVTDLFGTVGCFILDGLFAVQVLAQPVSCPRKKPEPAFFDSATSVLKYAESPFLASLWRGAPGRSIEEQIIWRYSFVLVLPEICTAIF